MKVELYVTSHNNGDRFPKVNIDGGTYYIESSYSIYDSIWCDMIETDQSILIFFNEYKFLNFDYNTNRKIIVDIPISDELMLYITLKYPDIIINNILFYSY